MNNGVTTVPEVSDFYVGNRNFRIALEYMIASNGWVVLHSKIIDEGDPENTEDFLYEVVQRHEAPEAAKTMIEDACEYLEELGVPLDFNESPFEFLARLDHELRYGLH